jgi:dTDP-4-dehydrorhamnose 3,5-epimerase
VRFIPGSLPGLILVEPRIFGDERGFFMETFQARRFAEAGIDINFVQDNHSGSGKGTLRGLHYQIQQAQGKLVRVVVGEVFDIAVDLRRSSSTFGKWEGFNLSAEKKQQLWIPPGFAHGFYVISTWAEVIYKVTGGAGFIGSNFVRYLLRVEPEIKIVNLDALTYAGSLENLNDLPGEDRHTFIIGDITDRLLVDELLRQHEIDTIVHFAAETHVDRSILGPAQFVQTNITGTFTLLEAARLFWLEEKGIQGRETRFHHVSTDEVYGTWSLMPRLFQRALRMPPIHLMRHPKPPAITWSGPTTIPTAWRPISPTVQIITVHTSSQKN